MDIMFRLGVIDSGIGGLTIVKDILENNLKTEIYYISDGENVPWGNKTQTFMFERISLMTEILINKKVDAILIACNTATAETINNLRQKFDISFIGVEPYINYINHDYHSLDRKFALILTEATYNSERFKNLALKFDPKRTVDIYPQKNLALLIESLKTKTFAEVKEEIDKELRVLESKDYTHLILGCTHYPIIADYIKQKFGFIIIDSTSRITQRIKAHLNIETSTLTNLSFYYSERASFDFKLSSLKDFPFLSDKKE